MKVQVTVDYTDEEIDQMIGILNFLYHALDNANTTPFTPSMIQWLRDGFENISNLLCLDPQGEKTFHRCGW